MRSVLAGAAVAQAAVTSMPTEAEYFGSHSLNLGAGKPWAIPRFANLTRPRFDELVAAGKPFVVTDITTNGDFRMKDWSCDFATKAFQGGRMRVEYDMSNHDESNKQKFEDDSWKSLKVPATSKAKAQKDNSPEYAPFYWDIKALDDETSRGWGPNAKKIQKMVKEAIVPPYCMDTQNQWSLEDSPEFWFSTKGAGAKAHMDEHCTTTLSVQLDGEKRWRLGWMPPPKEGVRSKQSIYSDGAVYNMNKAPWAPSYELTLKKGEGLVFPPGFVHETKNVGSTCAASVTYQFEYPAPSVYWRTFLPTARRIGDLHNCWAGIEKMVTAGDEDDQVMKGQIRWAQRELNSKNTNKGSEKNAREKLTKEAQERAIKVDQDGNGELTTEEIKQAFEGQAMEGVHAEDSHRYHDLDGDGMVSTGEFVSNYVNYILNEVEISRIPAVDEGADEEGNEEEEEEEEENSRTQSTTPGVSKGRVDKGLIAAGCRIAPSTGCVMNIRCAPRTVKATMGLVNVKWPSQVDCVSLATPALAFLGVKAPKKLDALFAALPRPRLRSLDLSMCGLGMLKPQWFEDMGELRMLNLEYNRLGLGLLTTKSPDKSPSSEEQAALSDPIPASVFHPLKKLKILWLTGNHYQKGEKGWKGRERVKNVLSHLHADQFKGLTQLQVLLMHHNQLQKLPPTLFRDQHKLRVLKLVDNKEEFDASSPVFRPLLADTPRCEDGEPSKGECLQLDLEADSGDKLEDIWESDGTYLDLDDEAAQPKQEL